MGIRHSLIAAAGSSVLLAALVGCQRHDTAGSQAPAPATVPTPPPSATPDEWRAAVASTFQELERKSEGDGVSTFLACFGAGEAQPQAQVATAKGKARCPAGSTPMNATRDGFRKITFFKSISAEWVELTTKYGGGPLMSSYISIPDCERPRVFVRAAFHGKNWLFMERLGVMVDGELLVDRDFAQGNVTREVLEGRVYEEYDFLPTPAELTALAKVPAGGEVLVRATGKKSYMPVKDQSVKSVKDAVRDTLKVHALLEKAVESKLPPGGCK